MTRLHQPLTAHKTNFYKPWGGGVFRVSEDKLVLFSIVVWCLWWARFCTRCVARTANKLTKSYCPRSLTFFILAWQLWQRSHIHQCLVVTINLLKNFNMYSNSLPSFNVNRTLHTLSFSTGIQFRALGAQVEGKKCTKMQFRALKNKYFLKGWYNSIKEGLACFKNISFP